MPLIINSKGKAQRIHPLDQFFTAVSAQHLSKLYDELANVSLHKATGEALDRLAEIWNLPRKDPT